MATEHYLVLCTCPTAEVAENIAQQLLDLKLAACTTIVPHCLSIYNWQGQGEKNTEFLLLIKTHTLIYKQMEAKIKEVHPYDLAEIIAIPIADGSADYLQWISDSVRKP